MEKRQYLPGYYIQWHNGKKEVKQKSNEPQTASNDLNNKQVIANNTAENNSSVAYVAPAVNNVEGNTALIASANNKQIFIPKTETFAFTKKQINKNVVEKVSKLNSKHGGNDRGDEGDNTTLSIVGLVLGILGCVGYYAGPLFGLAAIIVSAIALGKIKKDSREYGGKGMATWGLVLGIVSFVVWTAIIILYIAALTM
jgi:hypothetical protein